MLGYGLLTGTDGSIYEGEFHNHKKHGEGVATFRLVCLLALYFIVSIYSNGDCYKGGWIENRKHGHGQQEYVDGSYYEV